VTVNQVAPGTGGGGSTGGDSVTVALEQGWNLISLPWYVEAANRNPAVMFASLVSGANPNLNILWSYAACGSVWDSWVPNTVDPTLVYDGKGYWINLDSAATLTVTGALNPANPLDPLPSYPVCVGWNLIGFKNGDATKTIDSYLGGLSFVVAYAYDNGLWDQITAGELMKPGQGYWVAFTAAGTIYP